MEETRKNACYGCCTVKLLRETVHEVNNQLMSIMTYAHTLSHGRTILSSEDVALKASRILESVKIISGILDNARLIAGNSDVSRSVVNILDLVREQAQQMLPFFSRSKILFINISAEDCTDVSVFGNPHQLSQVFRNILINAVQVFEQWTDESRERKAGVSVLHGLKYVEIELWNNGPGLNQDERRRVFEPSYTTKVNGNGIGLDLSRRIIEDHGGNLSCESDGSMGVSFLIRLPLTEPPKRI